MKASSLSAARRGFDEAVRASRSARAPVSLVRALLGMGEIYGLAGDAVAERDSVIEALEVAEEIQDRNAIGLACQKLAALARKAGDLAEAERLANRAVEALALSGDNVAGAGALLVLGGIAIDQGRYIHGLRLLAAAESGLARISPSHAGMAAKQTAEADRLTARKSLGPKKVAAAWKKGSEMSVQAALGHAHVAGEMAEAGPPWASLTRSEIELVQLVLLGLPYGEIAAQLFVTTKTVQGHMNKIFEKMKVANRGELAKLAQETGAPSLFSRASLKNG